MIAARRYLLPALLVLAIVRFGVAFYSGLTYTHGDYYATLPGAYAEHVNPALWNSPDVTNVQGKSPSYLRGPTQYVTLYPMVYFDSYAAIATFLLVAYGLLILLIAEGLYRLLRDVMGEPIGRAPFFITTLCFFPLLQAWIGREFEVVILAAFVAAAWASVRNRQATFGAILGYITLYKYLPVIVVPYLIVRRWAASLVGFMAAAAALVALAYWLVGLAGFFSNHIPGMATGQLTSLSSTKAFCDGPVRLLRFGESMQEASVRTALCSLSLSVPIAPAVVYVLIVLLTVGTAAYGTFRLERQRDLPLRTERWRRVLEISLLALVATTFFYTHYYYLAVLLLPLAVVLTWVTRPGPTRPVMFTLWALAYLLLAAFLVPPSYLGRVLGMDVWRLYFSSLAYFSGEMILLALLLHQYVTLPLEPGDGARQA